MSALPNMQPDDTRARLIEAAGEVFAEHGFRAATVREICAKAGANIAAINYHFGDKMGLYIEVARVSSGTLGDLDPRGLQLDDKPAPEALRMLIANMVQRIVGSEKVVPHLRIMSQELTRPTEALPRIAEQVIGPNYQLLRGVIGRLLDLDPAHDTVRFCAHSVVGQVVHFGVGKPVIGLLWPAMKMTPPQLEQIAEHITEFSLAGIRAVQRKPQSITRGKQKI
jgi:AcrR family transcriptional regulator